MLVRCQRTASRPSQSQPTGGAPAATSAQRQPPNGAVEMKLSPGGRCGRRSTCICAFPKSVDPRPADPPNPYRDARRPSTPASAITSWSPPLTGTRPPSRRHTSSGLRSAFRVEGKCPCWPGRKKPASDRLFSAEMCTVSSQRRATPRISPAQAPHWSRAVEPSGVDRSRSRLASRARGFDALQVCPYGSPQATLKWSPCFGECCGWRGPRRTRGEISGGGVQSWRQFNACLTQAGSRRINRRHRGLYRPPASGGVSPARVQESSSAPGDRRSSPPGCGCPSTGLRSDECFHPRSRDPGCR